MSNENRSDKKLAVAPSMEPALSSVLVPQSSESFNYRSLKISFLAMLLGLAGGIIAQLLTKLIGLITNVFFYGRLSTSFISPADNHLGIFVIIIPVIGGIIVGLMARYGSTGIRGHGIA